MSSHAVKVDRIVANRNGVKDVEVEMVRIEPLAVFVKISIEKIRLYGVFILEVVL